MALLNLDRAFPVESRPKEGGKFVPPAASMPDVNDSSDSRRSTRPTAGADLRLPRVGVRDQTTRRRHLPAPLLADRRPPAAWTTDCAAGHSHKSDCYSPTPSIGPSRCLRCHFPLPQRSLDEAENFAAARLSSCPFRCPVHAAVARQRACCRLSRAESS